MEGALFYSLLILIGIGWCITKHDLEFKVKLSLFTFVALYIVLNTLDITNAISLSARFVNTFLILTLYLAMVICVMWFTNNNMRRLARIVNPDPINQDVVDSSSSSRSASGSVQLESTNSNTNNSINHDNNNEHNTVHTGERSEEFNNVILNNNHENNENNDNNKDTNVINNNQVDTSTESGNGHSEADFTSIPEAQEKLKLFTIFYKLFLAYVFVDALIGFIPGGAAFAYTTYYFNFIYLAGLCYVFRLRNTNQYFYLVASGDEV